MPRPRNLLRNVTIHFHIWSYSVTSWTNRVNSGSRVTEFAQVTHNAFSVNPINYWQNCTKGVRWSGVTFDSKVSSERHHRSVSRAASQRLVIFRKSWRVLNDRSFLGRCFWGFVLPVLEYSSAVWCSAADTQIKLLYRAASGTRFPTGGVFECDIAHRRSVSVLYAV